MTGGQLPIQFLFHVLCPGILATCGLAGISIVMLLLDWKEQAALCFCLCHFYQFQHCSLNKHHSLMRCEWNELEDIPRLNNISLLRPSFKSVISSAGWTTLPRPCDCPWSKHCCCHVHRIQQLRGSELIILNFIRLELTSGHYFFRCCWKTCCRSLDLAKYETKAKKIVNLWHVDITRELLKMWFWPVRITIGHLWSLMLIPGS